MTRRWTNPTRRVIFSTLAALVTISAWMALMTSAHAFRRSADSQIEHVLLISVDGMHQVDLERYLIAHPHSAFAQLVNHGVQYTHASTSEPSDSFPGLLAFMTGGSPRSHGVFYDDSYDRTLYAPGSNCTGAVGTETQ